MVTLHQYRYERDLASQAPSQQNTKPQLHNTTVKQNAEKTVQDETINCTLAQPSLLKAYGHINPENCFEKEISDCFEFHSIISDHQNIHKLKDGDYGTRAGTKCGKSGPEIFSLLADGKTETSTNSVTPNLLRRGHREKWLDEVNTPTEHW